MMESFAPLLGFLSSGVLTGIITLYVNYLNKKREFKEKDVDDRIKAWQDMSKLCEEKIAALEERLKAYDRDFRKLTKYITELERIIAKLSPDTTLPELPEMEYF